MVTLGRTAVESSLIQSDEVARWNKESKQHCPCTCMSGCSFQLVFERGSGQGFSGDTGFKFDWYSPEILIPFRSGNHTEIGELCTTCLCYLSSHAFLRQSRHDPKATKTLPQAKVNIVGKSLQGSRCVTR